MSAVLQEQDQGVVRLRKAKAEDFHSWLECVERLHKKCVYSHLELDRQILLRAYAQCTNGALGTVIIAERDGRVVGFIIGVVQQYWWSRKRFASDLALYSDIAGVGPRLVRQFWAWAKKIPGVVEITHGISSGVDAERTGEMYERMGLKKVGGVYTKFLTEGGA